MVRLTVLCVVLAVDGGGRGGGLLTQCGITNLRRESELNWKKEE